MAETRCSLLVVDDEPLVLKSLSAILGNDFEVLTADSAEAAQQVFAQREIHLILADHVMPGMTGVQLLEWVHAHSPKTVRLMMSGLAKLEDAVAAINCGQVHRYLFKPWRAEELVQIMRNSARTFLLERSHEQLLEELRRLNLELEKRVQERTRELGDANRQLQHKNSMLEKLALTDSLTGLPNRRAMDRLARSELRRRTRYPSALGLALVDADHFKEINSRYLLPGGDQALIALGQILIASLRTVDSVGRIGGEEFMVVAPETTLEGAVILAERIRSAVARSRTVYKDEIIEMTVSVGFAVAEAHMPADYDEMKHVAAAALEEAKSAGRNRCIVRPLPQALEQVG